MNDDNMDLLSRIREELKARRIYGQPCDKIELGIEAWHDLEHRTYLAFHYPCHGDLPVEDLSQGIVYGMIATCNTAIAPTCFLIK